MMRWAKLGLIPLFICCAADAQRVASCNIVATSGNKQSTKTCSQCQFACLTDRTCQGASFDGVFRTVEQLFTWNCGDNRWANRGLCIVLDKERQRLDVKEATCNECRQQCVGEPQRCNSYIHNFTERARDAPCTTGTTVCPSAADANANWPRLPVPNLLGQSCSIQLSTSRAPQVIENAWCSECQARCLIRSDCTGMSFAGSRVISRAEVAVGLCPGVTLPIANPSGNTIAAGGENRQGVCYVRPTTTLPEPPAGSEFAAQNEGVPCVKCLNVALNGENPFGRAVWASVNAQTIPQALWQCDSTVCPSGM